MIKTLRITIIVTAILAVVFFVLSAVFGLRHDKGKEAFLDKPSATEVFKKTAATRGSVEVEAPLIKQSQQFALRINPPAPPPTVAGPTEIVKPIETPKFKLLGTSVYSPDPNKSMALIDEPGKGMHWVVPSDKIDYLTVVRIEDGKIAYTDGKKTVEMFAEKQPEMPGIVVIPGNGIQVSAATPASSTGNASIAAKETSEVPAAGEEAQTPSAPTEEEIKSNAEFIRQIMAEANEVKATGESSASGMSPEEANQLQDLGEFLKKVEQEQAAEANAVKADSNSPQE